MRERSARQGLANSRAKSLNLLATKLRIPPARPELVPRDRLTRALELSASTKLALISAPAGFGKTTLVAAWARQTSKAVAWVALDEADNDPARFWSYFVAALHGVTPTVGPDVPLSLLAIGSGNVEGFLASLINEIADLRLEIAIVLDDYHLIHEGSIHRAMDYFLDHAPAQIQVIVASREEPSLALPRLRARGQLLELGPAELRFTPEEAAAFLRQTMGLSLPAEDVAALEARTEGWIAGLQLAALSLHGRRDASAFVAAFTGSQRYVLDYLAEEVFSRQPEATQRFLLLTSVLDRLSAPLADAVLSGRERGSGNGEADAREMLARLEKENLFLVPLDEERQWYRYHHLFADFLRNLLVLTYPDRIADLHAAASGWLEAHGFPNEALEHAIAARDFARAARLLESVAEDAIKRGEMVTLARWLRTLPEEYVRPSPRLCLADAWASFGVGDLEKLEDRLANAEAALPRDNPPRDVVAEIAALRSITAAFQGDVETALASSRLAMEKLPAGNNSLAAMVTLSFGIAYDFTGDAAAAKHSYLEATTTGQSAGNTLVTLAALAQLGDLQATRGELRYAAHLYRQALEMGSDDTGWFLMSSAAHVGLGRVLLEWNELDEAERHIAKGASQLAIWGGIGAWYADVVLAEARQARGDLEGAMDAMRRAEQLFATLRFKSSPDGHGLAEVGAAMEARTWLRLGQLDKANSWAVQVKWAPEAPLNVFRVFRDAALGRSLLAGGQFDKASAVLSSLAEAAEKEGWWGMVIDALPVLALAQESRGEGEESLATLRRALSLAEPEGYIRTFVQEGRAMHALLSRLLETLKGETARGAPGVSRDYVARLLAAFPTSDQPSAISHQPGPLSQREIELLRLLADGLSTREIAAELIIADGTVKRHLHNIYGKLDATSRTQAIAAARKLGLLD